MEMKVRGSDHNNSGEAEDNKQEDSEHNDEAESRKDNKEPLNVNQETAATTGETAESQHEDNDDDETEPLNGNHEGNMQVKTSKNAFPTDRGWAWVVLGACAFEVFIFGGVMRSFGVFFLEYQKRFNSSASETATMSLVQNIVVSVSALFIMTIGMKKFSSRAVVMFGGVFMVSSFLITAFTTNLTVFYIVQGGLGGVGLACVHPPMFVVLGTYFSRHKGLANSIFTAGASVGGLVFAPIVIKLFEEYGFTGTLMIVSALFGNIFVAGCIMRPPEFYTRHTKAKDKKTEDSELPNENHKTVQRHANAFDSSVNNTAEEEEQDVDIISEIKRPMYKQISNKNLEMRRMLSHDPSLMKANGCESPVLQRIRASSVGNRRSRTISETSSTMKENGSINKLGNFMKAVSRSQTGIYVSGASICGSFVDISRSIPTQLESAEKTNVVSNDNDAVIAKDTSCIDRFHKGLVSVLLTIFDLNLLKDKSFIYFLVLAFCGISSAGLIPIFIPTYANEIGVPNERIGLFVSIVAGLDFIAKISLGVVADRQLIRRNNILGMAFFTVGTACHFIRFIKTFRTMVIFVVIAGICCGQYMSTFAVIMSDLIGPERFKQSMGFITLTHGLSIAIFFPITGLIRDSTQSYVNALHLTGGLSYVAGLCAFTLPLVQKWVSPKQKEKRKDTEMT